jgi:hypothetical protein
MINVICWRIDATVILLASFCGTAVFRSLAGSVSFSVGDGRTVGEASNMTVVSSATGNVASFGFGTPQISHKQRSCAVYFGFTCFIHCKYSEK